MVIREFKPMYRGWVYESMLGNILLASAIPIIKRSLLKTGLFDLTCPSCQDWDMWTRIAKYYCLDFVDEVPAYIRIHPDRLSCNVEKRVKRRGLYLKKYLKDI